MKKTHYFLISSIIVNIISISLLFKIHQLIIDSFIDDLFFLRNEKNFEFVYLFSIFFMSWLAPFSIYKFKNYRQHFIVFLITLLTLLLSFIIYDVFDDFNKSIEYYNGLLDYGLEKSLYILFKEETLIASILISFLVFINQTIIGKKLLPKMYKRY